MAQALSDDLRLRVLKASAAGMSARQAAARFGVGISTAIRWIARAKQGEPTSRPQGWRRPSALDAHEAFVVDLIEDRKDVTLDEMAGLRWSGLDPRATTMVPPGVGVSSCAIASEMEDDDSARPKARPLSTVRRRGFCIDMRNPPEILT